MNNDSLGVLAWSPIEMWQYLFDQGVAEGDGGHKGLYQYDHWLWFIQFPYFLGKVMGILHTTHTTSWQWGCMPSLAFISELKIKGCAWNPEKFPSSGQIRQCCILAAVGTFSTLFTHKNWNFVNSNLTLFSKQTHFARNQSDETQALAQGLNTTCRMHHF